jgi:NAD-dependent SIR2 family protein deacetylase
MIDIKTVANIITAADALLIAAGAGMGVDSGLPDFRGMGGLYNDYPPFAKLGTNYMEMTRPSGLRRHPRLAWGFWGYQLNLYRNTIPHQGYTILLKLGESKQGNYFVETTNVDGQFQKAGFDADKIHDCHGSIHILQCIQPCRQRVWSAESLSVEIDPHSMLAQETLPTCPHCRKIARPHILMFGDSHYVWEATIDATQRHRAWLSQNRNKRMVIIECGAGETVPGLRRYCEDIAMSYPHATLIRINPNDTQVPDGENFVSLPMGALEALEQIASELGL